MPKSVKKAEKKRRFTAADFNHMADWIIEEYERRKSDKDRKLFDKHCEEVDRQVAMQPEVGFKKLPNGKPDTNKDWMAEMELPLQAQALEVLTADARRMMFAKRWFEAHSETPDEYLDRVDFKSFIVGDEVEVPSRINQDNADKMVEAYMAHLLRQNDFLTRFDRINAEAFKYGTGIGRIRMQSKPVFIHEAKGTVKKDRKIPVVVPVSVKNVYLDTSISTMHTSDELGPGHIAVDKLKIENVRMAANKGSTDPDDENGGWMPAAVNALEPDDNDMVELIEFEGDMVVPRKTVRSLFLPNVIITVAKGGAEAGGKVSRKVVRLRFNKRPFSSYLLCPYHYEGADQVYPTGPLMKGRPVAIMAADALNRVMDSAMLKNAPPVGYDPSSASFSQDGGPAIKPYAQWETIDKVEVYDEIGGDPSALTGVLTLALSMYSNLTGVLPGRLGAQTVSHTTAFSKNAEIERGAARTVDYVEAVGHGVLTRCLDIMYQMGRSEMSGKMSLWSDSYGAFISLGKDDLPENVSFEWLGSGGPADEAIKKQERQASMQTAVQLDQLGIQLQQAGLSGTVDIEAAIRAVLRDGGWTDLNAITTSESPSDGATPAPDVPGADQGNPGALTAALQGFAFGPRNSEI
jgi:hypothetical protein